MILIDGEIGWDMTSSQFRNEIAKETGDFEIHISSGGGSVFHGIAIFNEIKAYKRGKVTVIITSLAASIASYIALAADTVKAYDNAVYMIHNASVFAWGDHRELRKKADILSGLSGIIAKAYIAKTDKVEAEVQKMMNDETFLYGDEMLAHGFVDEMVSTKEDGNKEQAVALASETFTACLKASNERLTDNDYEQAAAVLKTVEPTNLEKPKPTEPTLDEDGVTLTEDEEKVKNSSKVNAIKARLSMKKKDNHERND